MTTSGSTEKKFDFTEFKDDQDLIVQFDVTSEILSLTGYFSANVKWKSNNQN